MNNETLLFLFAFFLVSAMYYILQATKYVRTYGYCEGFIVEIYLVDLAQADANQRNWFS